MVREKNVFIRFWEIDIQVESKGKIEIWKYPFV